MPSTVVLHVGLMKSGTTFLQQQLFAQREQLAERGVLLGAKSWGAQVAAVKDVLQKRTPDRWGPMVEPLVAHEGGPGIVSMELLGPAVPAQRKRIIDSLRPARVEVVITARDLNRSIVALWQETIQNGRWWTWQEYLDGARDGRPPADRDSIPEAGRTFWHQMNLARIARGWADDADQVTVVTVPPPGASPTLLLDRFAEAAGTGPMELAPGRANESLGIASTLALRRMNELLAERDLGFPEGSKLRKRRLAKRIMASRKRDEPSLGLDVPDWLAEIAAVHVQRVGEMPVRLIGDWADLTPVPVPGIAVGDVPEQEVTEAAVAGLAGLVEHCIKKNVSP